MKKQIRKSNLAIFVALLLVSSFLLSINAYAVDPVSGGYTWVSQNPLPASKVLISIDFVAAADAWTVGEYGTVMRWNGTTLTSYPSGTTNTLRGVASLTTTNAYAVGDNRTILHWNGTAWSSEVAPYNGYAYNLHGASGLADGNVWAIGDRNGFKNSAILHKAPAGAWHFEAEYANGGLNDIYAVSSTAVFVVGQDYTQPVGQRGRTIFSSNPTVAVPTWTLRDKAYQPIAVSAYDASNVWIVEWDGRVLRSNNGGVSYTVVSDPLLQTAWPLSVKALNATTAWVVGWDGNTRYYNGAWANVNTGTPVEDILDVDAFDVTHAAIGGTSKYMAISGGTATPARGGADTIKYSVSAYDANHVLTVGDYHAGSSTNTWRSTDGGNAWETAANGSGNKNYYGTIYLDATHAYGCGVNGSTAIFNGTSWVSKTGGTGAHLYGVGGCMYGGTPYVWAVGARKALRQYNPALNTWDGTAITLSGGSGTPDFRAITVLPSNIHGWIVGTGGTCYYYPGSGTTWSYVNTGTTTDLYGVDAVDDTHVWAVGDGGLIRFYNGSTWTTQTSGTTVQLRSISMINATNGFACGLNGTVLHWDGATWTTMDIGRTDNLYGISALDANNIWTVGQNGLVMFADPPYVNYVAPSSADPGESLTVEISGGYTHFGSQTTVDLGSGITVTDVNVWEPTLLYADISIDPGATLGPRTVKVTTGEEVAVPLEGGFVVGRVPTIASVSPNKGARGWTGQVEITGNATNFTSESVPDFGADITVNSVEVKDPEHLTADIMVSSTTALGSRSVNVITGAETPRELVNGFNVPTPPEVTSVSPTRGGEGTEVTINGTGFGDTQGTDPASGISFGNLPSMKCTSWSDTQVTCIAPSLEQASQVVVQTPEGDSNSNFSFTPQFTVTAKAVEGVGSVSPETQTVDYGGTAIIAITPPQNSPLIASITDNGISKPIANPYVINNVTENHEVIVSFKGKPAPRKYAWCLAEGSTAWGFDTYISLLNTNDVKANVEITWTDSKKSGGGVLKTYNFSLPANGRTTLNAKDFLGENDFSTKVISDVPITVDRTMVWDKEAHASIGVQHSQTDWYFAEGSSNWGFETWVLVQNPGDTDANVKIAYMTENGEEKIVKKVVPSNSRQSYNMANDIGNADASIRVSSDIPVIAERSMYRNNREEGHNTVGATELSQDYYLAEGTTAWGFTTYVLIANTHDVPMDVSVYYQTPNGEVSQEPFVMPAKSRKTIKVNDVPSMSATDCSIRVHGSDTLMAERAMYWNNGTKEACHDSIGTTAPHEEWSFADGSTEDGWETWYMVQNPTNKPIFVTIWRIGSYLADAVYEIPPNSRRTFNLALFADKGNAGVLIKSTNPVIVERSMYKDNRSIGTDTIGSY